MVYFHAMPGAAKDLIFLRGTQILPYDVNVIVFHAWMRSFAALRMTYGDKFYVK